MSFEIPYRTYISHVIMSHFNTAENFETAMTSKKAAITSSDPLFLRQILPNEVQRGTLIAVYEKFKTAQNSASPIISTDINLPMVGALNLVTFALNDCFHELYSLFSSYADFCALAERYRYARNKLDHPGCRTLEESHLVPVLAFLKDICLFLDDGFYIQKNKDKILSEINALQRRNIEIPIENNNVSDMPYGESRIVCREREIELIKSFVYGNPDDLRKRHSCCIYGHGGVGKTALVLEVIKEIVQDLLDNTTINGYSPKYLLFFSAKKRQLDLAAETGKVIERTLRWHFGTGEELIQLIMDSLERETLRNFHDEGIIVIDNLETLTEEERKKVKHFIEAQTPSEMQFIITSRNSEEYEMNNKLAGFEADSGKSFIQLYSEENNLELNLNYLEIEELLSLSKGNTLVLALCLRRLSQQLSTISGLKTDFSSPSAWYSLRQGLTQVPSNAYEVISEFMFKDTFEQIEKVFISDIELFYKVLKIFAVYRNDGIDINTICLLTQNAYPKVEAVVDTLCNYLILEKKRERFSLNGFSEKYIIGRFIPDANTYQQLYTEVMQRERQVKEALEQLEIDLQHRPSLAKIMNDWKIISDSDRITAAKMYSLYGSVRLECSRSGRFKVESIVEDFILETIESEAITAHPYIKYQKARILQLVDRSNILPVKHTEQIVDAYQSAVFIIETVDQYAGIQQTKSYASLLWLIGQFMYDNNKLPEAIRYLEKGKETFENQSILDQEYFKCISKLGSAYLAYYLTDSRNHRAYLKRAQLVSDVLQANYDSLGDVRSFAMQLKNRIKSFGIS